MSDLITYSIPGWEKYNPRTDRKNYKWFRFQNDFFIDPQIFSLPIEGKLLYQYLLCEASKQGTGDGVLNIELTASLTRIASKKIRSVLAQLHEMNMVTVMMTPSGGDSPPSGIATNETNERTNEHNHRGKPPLDFESVYFSYPKKVGKQNGLKKCRAEIKTQDRLDELSQAIENYKKYCEDNNAETQYIKQFDSFMSIWTDWIDFKPEKKKPKARAGVLRLAASTGQLDTLNEMEKEMVSQAGGIIHIGQRMSSYEFDSWLKNIGAC